MTLLDDRTLDFFARNALPLVPVNHRSKAAIEHDYTRHPRTVEQLLTEFKGRDINVGVLLQEPLVDVDLDFPINSPYFHFAHRFFPSSAAVYGRASRPGGHRLYRLKDKDRGHDTIKIDAFPIELRYKGEIQTVLPPSIHESGEAIEWADDASLGELTEVTLEELRLSARRFVAAAVLADIWTGMQGIRHIAALPLVGMLLKIDQLNPRAFGGVSEIRRFIRSVFEMAGDDETHDRMRAVEDTIRKFENGAERLTGMKRLIELIGSEDAIKRVRSLLLNDRILERVEKFNEQFASVNVRGSAGFIAENQPGIDHYQIWDQKAVQSHGSKYEKPIELVSGEKVKIVPFADWWMRSPDRRHYSGIVFDPPDVFKLNEELEEKPRLYNVFIGYRHQPVAGNVQPFIDYVHEVLADGNDEIAAWIMAWCADIVRHPGNRVGTSLVLRGEEGIGKTTIGNIMRNLLSPYGFATDRMDMLIGRFNQHLSGRLLVVANEAIWAGDRSQYSRLKGLITDDQIVIEAKGMNAYNEKNCMRFIFTTNDNWAVPASFTERRWMVLDVAKVRAGDKNYFRRLYSSMENGGYAALMHHLLTLDYQRSTIETVIRTEALRDQQEFTVSPVILWWREQLELGAMCTNVPRELWMMRGTETGFGGLISTELMLNSYYAWGRGQARFHNVTNVQFWRYLRPYLGRKGGEGMKQMRVSRRDERTGEESKGRACMLETRPLDEYRQLALQVDGYAIVPVEMEGSEVVPLTKADAAAAKHGI